MFMISLYKLLTILLQGKNIKIGRNEKNFKHRHKTIDFMF